MSLSIFPFHLFYVLIPPVLFNTCFTKVVQGFLLLSSPFIFYFYFITVIRPELFHSKYPIHAFLRPISVYFTLFSDCSLFYELHHFLIFLSIVFLALFPKIYIGFCGLYYTSSLAVPYTNLPVIFRFSD